MATLPDELYKTRKLAGVLKAYCSTDLKSVVVEWQPPTSKGGQSSKRTLVFSRPDFGADLVARSIAELKQTSG